jgi:hypothetical protein
VASFKLRLFLPPDGHSFCSGVRPNLVSFMLLAEQMLRWSVSSLDEEDQYFVLLCMLLLKQSCTQVGSVGGLTSMLFILNIILFLK